MKIMKLFAIPILVGAAVFVTACTTPSNSDSVSNNSTVPTVETSMPKDEPKTVVIDPIQEGKYMAFSQAEYEALKGEQKFGVFFHADWCPTCVKWEERTSAALDKLPEGTKILKADYDEMGDFAKSLGAKKQSTMVMFDSNGEIVDAVADPSVEAMAEFFTSDDFDVLGEAGEKYVEYNGSLESDVKQVVFFHADWCGTCRKWEKKLQASLSDLAPNTRIVKADFDNDRELAKQYEVTKQSQAVFLNADGSVAKTEGDPSIEIINEFFTT